MLISVHGGWATKSVDERNREGITIRRDIVAGRNDLGLQVVIVPDDPQEHDHLETLVEDSWTVERAYFVRGSLVVNIKVGRKVPLAEQPEGLLIKAKSDADQAAGRYGKNSDQHVAALKTVEQAQHVVDERRDARLRSKGSGKLHRLGAHDTRRLPGGYPTDMRYDYVPGQPGRQQSVGQPGFERTADTQVSPRYGNAGGIKSGSRKLHHLGTRAR